MWPWCLSGVAAGSLAELAKLLGGSAGDSGAVQTVTAGWAAGFIASIAMYFQVRAARAADKRLVLAGLPARRLASARAVTGLALALLAAAAAVVTLAVRSGISQPGRVLAGTVMFAVIYLAVGALAGALAASPVNGTVLFFFVWIADVMFGPVFGSAVRPAIRLFPTHFVTLWMIDLPSHHAGRVGDLGWALAWTAGAAILAWAVVTVASRTARARRSRRRTTLDQLRAAIRAGLLDWGRNRVLWVLLGAVPAVFIVLATALAPGSQLSLPVDDNGRQVSKAVSLAFGAGIHPAFMAPMAIAALATLAGMFMILDSRAADQRLALAGQRTGPLLADRLTLIVLAGAAATGVSLAVTATVSDIRQWASYAAASALLALTYALIGAILAPLFGRVAGVLIAFLIPFLDLGIAQDPMLHPVPPTWMHFLPGYGGFRVLSDAILTRTFDQTGPLLTGLAWLGGLTVAAVIGFRHAMRSGGIPTGRPAM